MKICIIGSASSIHIQKWCESIAKKGNDVLLLSLYNGNESDYYNVKKLPLFLNKSFFTPFCSHSVKKHISDFKPDILHAFYITSYGLLAILSGFRPTIITALGTDIRMTHDQVPFSSFAVKYTLRKASHISSVANHLVPRMKKLGAKDVNIILPIPVDTKIFTYSEISKRQNYILCTRALEKVYNTEAVILSMPEIIKKFPDVYLKIIGVGRQEKYLKKLVKKLKIEEKIMFLGNVSLKDLIKSYQEARLFCSFSFTDGTPVSLLEAMSTKTPIAASNIPANKEWLSQESCFYADPNNNNEITNAILKSLSLDEKRQNTAVNINYKTILKRADSEKIMNQAEKLYKKIIQNK